MATLIANLRQFEAQEQSFQLQLRAKYTLDALNQLARDLSGIPGRKNLIWFSGSFPISILPDGDLQNPFAVVASAEEEFRETINMLARSQVAVYPIDARGLMVSPRPERLQLRQQICPQPYDLRQRPIKFFQQTADEHSTMRQMAERPAAAPSSTPTTSPRPSPSPSKPAQTSTPSPTPPPIPIANGSSARSRSSFRQQGYTLAYRRGYYADNPNAPSQKRRRRRDNSSRNAPPPLDPMRAAMIHGGPDPTQILIKVASSPPPLPPDEDKPATRQRTRPGPKDPRPLPPLRHRLRRRRPRRPLRQVPRRLNIRAPCELSSPLRPGWQPGQPRRRQDPRHPHRRRLHRPVTPRRPMAPGDQRPSQRQLLPPHRSPRPQRRPRRCRRSSHRLRQKSTLTRGSKVNAAAPAVTFARKWRTRARAVAVLSLSVDGPCETLHLQSAQAFSLTRLSSRADKSGRGHLPL